jgi:hypothetical protein
MTKALHDAVKKFEKLSEEQQFVAASILEDIAGSDAAAIIAPEERGAVEEAIKQIKRGEHVEFKDTALAEPWS